MLPLSAIPTPSSTWTAKDVSNITWSAVAFASTALGVERMIVGLINENPVTTLVGGVLVGAGLLIGRQLALPLVKEAALNLHAEKQEQLKKTQ